MKKLYIFIILILNCTISIPALAQCFEGGPCGTTGYSGGGGYIWRTPPPEQSHEELRAATQSRVDAAGKAADIRQCNDRADTAKKTCEGAYNQLNTICNAYTNALTGFGVRGLLEKFGATLPSNSTTAILAISTSATYASVGPCSLLVPTAMAYCAAGAEKMKAACPK